MRGLRNAAILLRPVLLSQRGVARTLALLDSEARRPKALDQTDRFGVTLAASWLAAAGHLPGAATEA